MLVAVLLLLALVGRLAQLQLLHYDRFAGRSEGNVLRLDRVPPLRGEILTRDGVLLAGNRVATDLIYRGGPIDRLERIDALTQGAISRHRMSGAISAAWRTADGRPIAIAPNLPEEVLPALAELTADQPALDLIVRTERTYPAGFAVHAVGYTREAPEAAGSIFLGDLVGADGVEAMLDERLRGAEGWNLVRVNARGVVLASEVQHPVTPGVPVTLTLDSRLQLAAERALAEAVTDVNRQRVRSGLPADVAIARGAIVAMDPRTGAVLALASSPVYDPNVFNRRPVSPEVATVLTSPEQPLLNRALLAYEPGSIFKPVTAKALLDHGYVTPGTTFRYLPVVRIGTFEFRNWGGPDRGRQNIVDALAWSTNTWFWQAALEQQLDPWHLVEAARGFGFGSRTGLGLPNEAAGLFGDPDYHRAAHGEPWRPGNTLNALIGQGDTLTTPLQIAVMLATVANGGRVPTPTLVAAVGGEALPPPPSRELSGTNWSTIQQGLREVATHGTAAWLLHNFPVPVAGKTGTAQNVFRGLGREHAWFMAYAPFDDPRLVVVAFLEFAGEGSSSALPATAKVLRAAYDLGLLGWR